MTTRLSKLYRHEPNAEFCSLAMLPVFLIWDTNGLNVTGEIMVLELINFALVRKCVSQETIECSNMLNT